MESFTAQNSRWLISITAENKYSLMLSTGSPVDLIFECILVENGLMVNKFILKKTCSFWNCKIQDGRQRVFKKNKFFY